MIIEPTIFKIKNINMIDGDSIQYTIDKCIREAILDKIEINLITLDGIELHINPKSNSHALIIEYIAKGGKLS